MKKTILEIYALATCFIALIFLIINISEGAYNTIGLIKPDLTMSSYTYDYLQTDERYRKNIERNDKTSSKTDEEISRLRLEAYDIEIKSEARSRFQKIIKNIIYILIAGIVLLIHWKLSKSARETNTQ